MAEGEPKLSAHSDIVLMGLDASKELGRNTGRIEAFMESSEIVIGRIPEIIKLISEPDEALKVMNALTKLASDIMAKR